MLIKALPKSNATTIRELLNDVKTAVLGEPKPRPTRTATSGMARGRTTRPAGPPDVSPDGSASLSRASHRKIENCAFELNSVARKIPGSDLTYDFPRSERRPLRLLQCR